jgi:hypothetical protein
MAAAGRRLPVVCAASVILCGTYRWRTPRKAAGNPSGSTTMDSKVGCRPAGTRRSRLPNTTGWCIEQQPAIVSLNSTANLRIFGDRLHTYERDVAIEVF